MCIIFFSLITKQYLSIYNLNVFDRIYENCKMVKS